MRRGLITGIILWLLLTSAIHSWNGALLPRDPAFFSGVFLIYGGFSLLIALALLKFVCPQGKTERFGLGIAIPGLILGATTMLLFGELFPDGTPSTRGHYGTLMLWTYGLILSVFAILVPAPFENEDDP